MTNFWLVAGTFLCVALAFLLVPLWRENKLSGQWSVSGLLASLAVVPIAVGLYLQVTTFNNDPATVNANDGAAMVQQLAEKLVENPADVEGWLLLGRSYMALGEYRLARDAYFEAWDRTDVPDAGLKLALGEAMIYADGSSISAQAADLIEDALFVEPTNQRALWWGGVVAMERGQLEVAKDRWNTLLSFNPPAEVAEVIRRQLSVLPSAGNGGLNAGPSAGQRTAAGQVGPGAGATPTGPTVTINVSIAPDMPLDTLGPNSFLFILARAPGGAGPPIAAIRHPVSALPGQFVLSDTDAIIAGRSLSTFPELALLARIAVNGDPIEQPGDLYAETSFKPGETDSVELVIDQIVAPR